MADRKPLKWNCVGMAFINGNPFNTVKLSHAFRTNKYKVIVDGITKAEYQYNNWTQADNKYREIIKELNHQSKITI